MIDVTMELLFLVTAWMWPQGHHSPANTKPPLTMTNKYGCH